MFVFAYYSIVKSFYLEQSSLVYIIYDYNDYNPFFLMKYYVAVHSTVL